MYLSFINKKEYSMKAKWFFPKIRKAMKAVSTLKDIFEMVKDIRGTVMKLKTEIRHIQVPAQVKDLTNELYDKIIALRKKVNDLF